MMVKKVNYHTHTTGSDGELSPEELIKLAIKKKFDILGITDHYHHPPGFRDWGNGYYSDEHYLELNRLKEKYEGKIKVLVGVEFDWIEKYRDWIIAESKKRKYDYSMISMHFLFAGGDSVPIDNTEESFVEILEKVGDIKKLIKFYYKGLRDAVSTGCFDVVAHFDLIKLWNKDSKYFSDKEDWYREEVMETLKLIKKKNMKLDLNTKGLRKPCGEPCPSEWIVKEAKKMGIELLIGTDAHATKDLEAGLKEVGGWLK